MTNFYPFQYCFAISSLTTEFFVFRFLYVLPSLFQSQTKMLSPSKLSSQNMKNTSTLAKDSKAFSRKWFQRFCLLSTWFCRRKNTVSWPLQVIRVCCPFQYSPLLIVSLISVYKILRRFLEKREIVHNTSRKSPIVKKEACRDSVRSVKIPKQCYRQSLSCKHMHAVS